MLTEIQTRAADAVTAIFAKAGPNKGRLLAKAPPFGTDAWAAWHGAMLACNPYKASIMSLMMMNTEQRAIADAVEAAFRAMPDLAKRADRDRAVLEALGAW